MGPAVSDIERFNRLLIYATKHLPKADRADEFRPWQPQIIRGILSHTNTILQGCRQATGKTYIAAVVACIDLLNGERDIYGMPSLRQGSRIGLRRILNWMSCLEPILGVRRRVDQLTPELDRMDALERMIGLGLAPPEPLKRTKNDALEVEWITGAGILAISTNEQATAGTQGYTGKRLFIDEAHEARDEYYGYYSPVIDVALRVGHGGVLVMGPGGDLESVIECKKEQDFHLEFWDDERILEMDPSWRPVFERKKLELTPEMYDQMYRLLPVSAGKRYVFPHLVERADPGGDCYEQHYVTIDVGKIVDSTAVSVTHWTPTTINVLTTRRWHGQDYVSQVHEIWGWINSTYYWRPENIIIEINGPGGAFADVWRAVTGISPRRYTTTDTPGSRKKTRCIEKLQVWAREGRLAVNEESSRRELMRLTYDYRLTDQGAVAVWPHSDLLSTLWLLVPATMQAVGV